MSTALSDARLAPIYRRRLRLISSRQRVVAGVVLVAALVWLPSALNGAGFLGITLININSLLITLIAAAALNLLVGYAGLISVGSAALLAVGALAAGVIGAQLHLPFLLALVAAGAAGGFVGALVGLPSLRVRGMYLMLSTWALQFLGVYGFTQYESHYFGYTSVVYPTASILSWKLTTPRDWYFALLVATGITLLCIRNLVSSRRGRSFIAIRDNEQAAIAMGVNVGVVKIVAFAISSMIISAAGALYAYNLGVVDSSAFTIDLVIGYFAIIIVGGMGSLWGPVLGAILWTLVPQILEHEATAISPSTPVFGTALATYPAQTVNVVFGIVVITILVAYPAGLSGMVRRLKEAVARWPYTR